MSIAAQLRIFTLLILIVSAGFGYSFWHTSKNLNVQRNVNNIIQAIIKNTFQFSSITNEYLATQNSRIQSQWANSHASLESTFAEAINNLGFEDDKISLNKIMTNEAQAEEFIMSLVEYINNDTSKTHLRKVTQTISQIHIRVQGMLSEASRMSLRSLERLTAAEKQLERTSTLLIFIYFAFFIVAIFLVQRKILLPISNLNKNAHRLALGEYNSRIPVTGKNEISDLAEAYNTLANEIEKKINSLTDKSVRLTASQNELLQLNNNLQSMVEEQTSELRNNENKQRAILESMSDGLITIDSEFTIKSINPAITKLFNYTESTIVNQKINMIISDLKDVSKQSGIFYEKRGHNRNGTTFPIEIALNRMIIDDSIMYACTIRDITERKRVEKMKDEFVSTVSHELRTPLTSIRGALGLITSGALNDLPEKASELLDTAHRNTERLMNLINDILDMQKIEAGKLDFNSRQFVLQDAIHRSLTDNLHYAKEYNVNIMIGDSVEDVIVNIDPLRLAQVMSNLLSNAAKFSKENGTVFIHTTVDEHQAKISVVDSGEGIPKEYFDKIFHKFSQNDASSTKEKGGTGLGLAISKEMIQAMGGSIDFTSTAGQGSSFNIYIPLA